MRILKDFKMPKIKLPKFKMNNLGDLEDLNLEYIKNSQERVKEMKDFEIYEPMTYRTVKEIFQNAITEHKDRVAILEKGNIKRPFGNTPMKSLAEM